LLDDKSPSSCFLFDDIHLEDSRKLLQRIELFIKKRCVFLPLGPAAMNLAHVGRGSFSKVYVGHVRCCDQSTKNVNEVRRQDIAVVRDPVLVKIVQQQTYLPSECNDGRLK